MKMADPDKSKSKTLALLAGAGRFPIYLAEAARTKGFEVVVIGLEGRLEPGMEKFADKIRTFRFARFSDLLGILEAEKIERMVMAGKADKRWLYQPGVEFDDLALAMLKKLPDRKDDTLMSLIVRELESRGIQILETIDLIREWLAPEGPLTRQKPDAKQSADIEFGFRIAKEIGRLDLGQTVAVLDRAVLAVEAIEGTDLCILRAGQMSPGAVIVKALKPGQSLKFDVPVAGLSTVQTMVQAQAKVLAVEAGGCLLVEREEMVKLADSNGICLMGVRYQG